MDRNLIVVENPLVSHYLTYLRDKNTTHVRFRDYLDKISLLLASETSKELSLRIKKISTPLAQHNGRIVFEEVVLVPILRAGLGLVNGFVRIFPDAKVSHIGIYRDEENLMPVKYYFKFPRHKSKSNMIVFILDPMLATGGSINCAVNEIKNLGIRKIVVATLVSAPEGINEVRRKHKSLKIYTCAVDKKLNEWGYIIPGLGDAGDRIFGT